MLFDFNPESKDSDTFNLYEGFIRGNCFKNIYEDYKDFKVFNLKPTSKQDEDLLELMILDFTINDLNLYLATHPNCNETFEKLKHYNKIYKDKKEAYEKNYQVIDLFDDQGSHYTYGNSPWPWEVKHV